MASTIFLLCNCQRPGPFSNSVISGNFYEIINNILEISDDTYYYYNGDYAFASPSILIDNMSIAGE